MKKLYIFLLLLVAADGFGGSCALAQDDWPRMITTGDGSVIQVFFPQPDSIFDNNIRFCAAFSLSRKPGAVPVYGSFQAYGLIATDKNNRTLDITGASIFKLDMTVPLDPTATDGLRQAIECGIPSIGRDLSLDRIVVMLNGRDVDQASSWGIDHTPPRIIVRGAPSLLVLIDGIPRLKWNKDYGVYVIANSPYLIVGSTDGWFYLYGGRHWYIAPMPEGPYNHTTYLAPDLQRATALVNAINDQDVDHSDTLREGNAGVMDVVTTLTPAEVLQTRGAPVFSSAAGTHLLYVSNSNNDIFLDSSQHRYYILVSGRWFTAPALTGLWQYIPADSLPGDFSRIREGSPEDRVLACVPGTAAAREAITEASIPQTAFINRHTATVRVNFDGPPKFVSIRGTHLEYAVNSCPAVIRSGKMLYCVDKGVWFCATAETDSWIACSRRPLEVDRIPPDYPVYHYKYVYIYSADSNYISAGYTAGYLGSYIDGHTLVYGTGYYSSSYAGNTSIPRPWTYGFNMWYNPWYGWSLGYDYSLDWLNTVAAWGQGYWTGGWWGPAAYRPPYIWHHFSGHGLYASDIRHVAGSNYNNNLYTLRDDVVGRSIPERIVTDGKGGVFCSDGKDGWLRRSRDGWVRVDAVDSATSFFLGRLDRQQQRGSMRVLNFLIANGLAAAAGLTAASPLQISSYAQTK